MIDSNIHIVYEILYIISITKLCYAVLGTRNSMAGLPMKVNSSYLPLIHSNNHSFVDSALTTFTKIY